MEIFSTRNFSIHLAYFSYAILSESLVLWRGVLSKSESHSLALRKDTWASGTDYYDLEPYQW